MADPVGDIIGDYRAFAPLQRDRLAARGIDIAAYNGCVSQGATFDGIVHVDDWVPQRLVTATGPNPRPR